MQVTLPNYRIEREIASGVFGREASPGCVYLTHDVLRKRKVALKRVLKVGSKLSREYEILASLKGSKHVVQILVD